MCSSNQRALKESLASKYKLHGSKRTILSGLSHLSTVSLPSSFSCCARNSSKARISLHLLFISYRFKLFCFFCRLLLFCLWYNDSHPFLFFIENFIGDPLL